MSREAVGKIIDRWVSDEKFRAEIRLDPKKAVWATGAQLSEDEWAALKTIDWALSDQELQARANKM